MHIPLYYYDLERLNYEMQDIGRVSGENHFV